MKQCPLCDGSGFVKQSETEKNIILLKDKGLTVREIAKVVGKSSTAVQFQITKSRRTRT